MFEENSKEQFDNVSSSDRGESVSSEQPISQTQQPDSSVSKEKDNSVQVNTQTVDYEQFKATAMACYENLIKMIRIVKVKDENLAKLTAEVQMYREGFALKLVKPVLVALISMREDYKNTCAKVEQFAKSVESVVNYSKYVVADFEDLLLNQGLESDGEIFKMGGKPLAELEERTVHFDVPKPSEQQELAPLPELPAEPSFASLIEIIKCVEWNVISAIRNSAAIDETLSAYVALAASYEDNYADALLLPLYKKTAAVHSNIKGVVEAIEQTITEDNKAEVYKNILEEAIEQIDKLLVAYGVDIISIDENGYDMRRCKIVKVILTDDENKDKKVAKCNSDCYEYDGKLLYPSKVEVYKYNKN